MGILMGCQPAIIEAICTMRVILCLEIPIALGLLESMAFFALPFVEGAPFPFVEGAVEPEPEAFSVFTGFRRVLSVVISKMIRSWNEYRP